MHCNKYYIDQSRVLNVIVLLLTDWMAVALIYIYEFHDMMTKQTEMVASNLDLLFHDAYYLKHKHWEIENTFNYLTKYCNITHNFILECKNLTTLFQLISYNFVNLYFKHYVNLSALKYR